jgi:3-oxoacyl-[acyl-carrier protein] reductase
MFIPNKTMPEPNKVLIIGGTSGIGLATAYHLNEKGYEVIVAGRRSLNLEGIETIQVDVRNEESIANLFNVHLARQSGIDALIYASGITTPREDIQAFNRDTWDEIVSTNITGALLTLKYAYAALKNNRGRVVVINSLAGRKYSQLSGVEYTASKAALSGLVRQLAVDWAPDRVLINSVYPGMTLTPMLAEHMSDTRLNEIETKIPLGKIARPADIARAIEFLISPENTHMTGTGIDVCGGQFLSG